MPNYLQQMVERSSAELLARAKGGKPMDGVMFLGNPQLVFPALLYDDPLLEPVDWAVWVAMKRYAAEGNTVTAIPPYGELMRRSHVGSKATIARSIAILRVTRWLTVCSSKLRDPGGRIRGNIYALHDEPLQLAESMELDGGYLQWMEETAQGRHNPHPRAVAVASNLLRDLHDQIRAGVAVEQPEKPTERRMRAIQYLADRAQDSDADGRFFAASARSVRAITSRAYQKNGRKSSTAHPSTETVLSAAPIPSTVSVPIPSTVSVPHAHAGSSSNSSLTLNTEDIRNTTTNTLPNSDGKGGKGGGTESVLAYPPTLEGINLYLVKRELVGIPNQFRQPVLDVLADKLAKVAAKTTAPLTYGVMPYFRTLCQLAIAGRLNPVPAPIAPSNARPGESYGQARERLQGEAGGSNQAAVPAGGSLKATQVRLSNIGNEIKYLEQIGEIGGYVPEELVQLRAELADVQQRYRELQQQTGGTGC